MSQRAMLRGKKKIKNTALKWCSCGTAFELKYLVMLELERGNQKSIFTAMTD